MTENGRHKPGQKVMRCYRRKGGLLESKRGRESQVLENPDKNGGKETPQGEDAEEEKKY